MNKSHTQRLFFRHSFPRQKSPQTEAFVYQLLYTGGRQGNEKTTKRLVVARFIHAVLLFEANSMRQYECTRLRLKDLHILTLPAKHINVKEIFPINEKIFIYQNWPLAPKGLFTRCKRQSLKISKDQSMGDKIVYSTRAGYVSGLLCGVLSA